MKRSVMREFVAPILPDSAALHPGYGMVFSENLP